MQNLLANFAALDVKALVDIGFVVLVSLSCLPALFGRSERSQAAAAERWKEEILDLEQSLRDLIKEASYAGSNLDRTLLQRRRELESLVVKIENAEKPRSARVSEPDFELSDLPNPTWGSSKPRAESERELIRLADLAEFEEDKVELNSSAAHSARTPLPSAETGRAEKLRQLRAEMLSTRGAAESAPLRRPTSAPFNGRMPEAGLARQIEASSIEDDDLERSFSHIDPTALKVAKRLLLNGQEIHIVARKLDLPVAEVRMIDRVLRSPAQPAAPIFRQTAAAVNGQGERSRIEREVALL